MNVKKPVAISDHFPNWASPRKKIVSGFGLGFVAFFIFLFVLFLNTSFKNPISNKPFFQGFNISNNGSFIAWSFSFSRTSSVNSTYASSTVAALVENATQVEKNLIVDTHLGNFTGDVKNGSFNGISANVRDFEDNNFMKHEDDMENGTVSAIAASPNEGKVTIGQEIGNVSVKSVGLDPNFDLRNKRDDNFNGVLKKVDKDHGTISKNLRNFSSSLEECDLFDGRWVRDDTKPYYPAGSCPYVDKRFNCHHHKRPDNEFEKWRWQPFGCEIPSLNATDFLERLRGKKLVFVGDSLNRNMWESLVCILRHSLNNKARVYNVSERTNIKIKRFFTFQFEDYNCTVNFAKSPFLVNELSFKGKKGPSETLRLDLMDLKTSLYHDADILIFNTGHWWNDQKTFKGENYYQEGNHVYPKLKILDAYTKALSTWATWVDNNIDSRKTQVFFRGMSVTHFNGGRWNSGGKCNNETEPIYNTSQLTIYPPKMRIFDDLLRVMKTPVTYLNITRLTDYRKDGHPSIYSVQRKPLKQHNALGRSQDCSHWCLPGVPDTWNELLYASLLKIGRGSWKR